MVGILHGFAGSAPAPALALVPVVAHGNIWSALVYLVLFSTGVMLAMLVFGLVFGSAQKYIGQQSVQLMNHLHHVIAFPQIGPGKGDGRTDSEGNTEDFGRERETAQRNDRYRFRTASLLNIEVSAPYGHAGAYQSLDQVLRHYDNPRNSVDDYFDDTKMAGWQDQ